MLDAVGLDLGEFFAMMMFLIFMIMILTGYNVAFSFASTAVAFTFFGDVLDVFNSQSLNTLPLLWAQNLGRSGDTVLLAVPLFVLMGAILERSGLAERLLRAIGMLMGPLRGGVAAAVIVVGTLLAAATGVVAATVIVMGLLSLPAMVALGYDHKLATGAITASGTLAQLLPPSLVLILLAQQMGVGIIGLFAGALIPGLLLSGFYVVYALGISAIKPEVGPAMPKDQRTLNGDVSTAHAVSIGGVLALLLGIVILSLSNLTIALIIAGIGFVVLTALLMYGSMLVAEVIVSIIPTVLLIMGVLAAIFRGIATPSEAGSIGVLGALLLGGLNYYFDKVLAADGGDHIDPTWRLTPEAMREAGKSTGNITILVLTLVFSSTFFSLVFRELGGSDKTSEWLTSIGGGKTGFVLVAMVAVFILGINLEFLEITFIVVPIFVPALQQLQFTEVEIIWFTVLMAVNLNMAFISPPVGFSLFYLQSVAPPEVKTADIHKGAIPFMVLQGIAIIVLGLFPGITEFSYDLFVTAPGGG